jgi:hypothetical protein
MGFRRATNSQYLSTVKHCTSTAAIILHPLGNNFTSKERNMQKDLFPRIFFKFLGVGRDWVHLVRRPLFGLLYHSRMIDDECGAVGEMRLGRGNRSTRKKPAPVLLGPPQLPHNLGSNSGAAVGNQRLTAWAMARSSEYSVTTRVHYRASLSYSDSTSQCRNLTFIVVYFMTMSKL